MAKEVRNSVMLAATETYVAKIQEFAGELQVDFTDYQKNCVVNAVRAINPMLETQGYVWQDFNVDNIYTVLQQTAFLQLNPSATPRECYFIVRKGSYDKKTRTYGTPKIEFGVEGAGNDIILRKFGQDVKDLRSYIVYEGDDFTPGYIDGWDIHLPKFVRKFKTNKPKMAVYLIKKNNGEIDVQYADTLDVKKSLLANARQNGAEEKLLRQLNQLDLYEILEDENWINYKIKKSYGNNTYETPLFNPSYTSAISMYNMIERKLRNHATRKYPKNFNQLEVQSLYEESFEEKYNEKGEIVTAEEHVEVVTQEIETKSGKETLAQKETKTPQTQRKLEDDRPTFEVIEEDVEDTTEYTTEYTTEESIADYYEGQEEQFNGAMQEPINEVAQEETQELEQNVEVEEVEEDYDSDSDWDL